MSYERSNPYKGEFSPTGIETAFCYRKFYLNKMLGLESNAPPIALHYGSAIHKGVETFYKLKPTMPHVEVKIIAIQEAVKEWQSYGIQGDDKRNLAGLLQTLDNYFEYYKDDNAQIAPEFVEATQWIEMPNSTHMLFKIDRVRIEGERRIVVDTKTSSWPLTDFYFQDYKNNLQTSLYFYGVDKILDGCDGVQIDGIKVPPPAEKSATVPFVRRTFVRSGLQIADAINTWCRVTDYIMAGIEKYKDDSDGMTVYMYCNQKMCGDYGGCKYLPICMHGFDHPSVQVDFTRKEITKESENE